VRKDSTERREEGGAREDCQKRPNAPILSHGKRCGRKICQVIHKIKGRESGKRAVKEESEKTQISVKRIKSVPKKKGKEPITLRGKATGRGKGYREEKAGKGDILSVKERKNRKGKGGRKGKRGEKRVEKKKYSRKEVNKVVKAEVTAREKKTR